jgi:hypothetical protein
MSVLDKVRRWIDGDSAEGVLEEAARDAQVKPRSISEEFIVKLARAVEEVMQREIVPLPQGTALIPTEYIIFLSEEDDKEWQGVKRKGLEQGLYHVLAERAKEISGKKKLETQSFSVELRVDGTLPKGETRIQHSWEDSASNKTSILSRPKSAPHISHPRIANPVTPSPNFAPITNTGAPIPPTMAQSNFSDYAPPVNQESEEMTQVRKKQATELYKLEIWRGGVRQNVIPIYENEIGVGRGSKSKPVDVALSGDPEISRRHLTIVFNNGSFGLISEGRNPAIVSGREVPTGQRMQFSPGEPITICSYLLRVQPR